MDALVAHYHEVGLKGRNRDFFEEALTRNLRRALRGTGYSRINRRFGRIIVHFFDDNRAADALERAARVFGVAYVGAGVRVPLDLDAITGVALDLMEAAPFESFAVRARRTYSSFATRSQDINIAVGQAIKDATGARVDLTHPEATAWIELFGNDGIVYRRRERGPGGLPVGVSGKMLALLSGGIDSPVAAWRMARRGADVEMLHFHGQPYTDPSSLRQAVELCEVLARYQLRTVLHLVPLADAQREIVTNAPSSLRVVLYRRTMMRIASALARDLGAQALVTGDSLGQVASQTIENIHTVDSAVAGTQVLRPLIGMDKQEIIDASVEIGTYDLSTRRYQDCCVLFEPRSPATRSNPALAERAESGLDMDAIVGKALAGMETRVFELPDPAAQPPTPSRR
ncbi:MAG TPA: tRNA uracil 4-sulfurtransferase ThiI [Actinomycetota bacterium]|nr:tRNA uracil 4-sulfurtransferase ThiI [Actinomycetota bacterium]